MLDRDVRVCIPSPVFRIPRFAFEISSFLIALSAHSPAALCSPFTDLSRHSPRAQAAPAFALPHSAFRDTYS
jgi:hypothetical protein